MAKHNYTAKVSDFSGAPPAAGASLRARVRPLQEASGPDGQLVSSDVPVALNSAGVGSFQLVASVDTAPVTRYELVVDWIAHTRNGQDVPIGGSRFEFTAVPGGGDIRTMGDAPSSAVFFTPNWPTPRIPGVYVDLETGNVYRKGI